ncbi:MAG: hypothetical protein ACI8X5_003175 [Planctomycetota bacterium]|jgi:hypothetical protein
MKSNPLEHDEEFRGLMQELVGAKNSTLLRRPPPEMRKSWAEPSGLLSENSPSLSSLEKKLLATYRQDLGQLFSEACLRVMFSEKGYAVWALKGTTEFGQDIEPLSDRAWVAKRKGVLGRSSGDRPLEDLDRILGQCGNRGGGMLELAEAGLVVAPTDALRVFRAQGLELIGQFTPARQQLEDVHCRAATHRNRRLAADAIGRLCLGQGDLRAAVDWYSLAGTGPAPLRPGVLTWLFHAIQLGDESSATRAMDVISDDRENYTGMVEMMCRRKVTGRLALEWQPSEGASRVLRIETHRRSNEVEKICSLFV